MDKRLQDSRVTFDMNEGLRKKLEDEFAQWVFSPDNERIVAWNPGKGATIFATKTGETLLSIDTDKDRWYWSPNGKELVSHDYIITSIWDATTGKFLRSVEAKYERPE